MPTRCVYLAEVGPGVALYATLTHRAKADPKPLVLLIDEIDALNGDSLLSVLRQLRAGYDLRPKGFPQSVVLCVMHVRSDAFLSLFLSRVL